MADMTPEEEQALTRLLLWTKLSTYSFVEVLLIGMNSEDEAVELWALNGLRDFGRLLIRQQSEPGYKTGIQYAIDLMKKL